MAYAEEKHSLRQVSSIAGVVLVHAAIGYAFISGLAYQVYTELPTILQVINIPEDTPPPPPPPEPRAEARTERVSVPDKVVTVVGQPGDGIVAPPPPLPTTEQPTIDPAPPPMPSMASGPRVKGVRARWITTEDYPSSSVRNNEEGSVAITVRVGADGRVASCEITTSSGYPALDALTCRLYARRARFDPALDSNGAAIPATYSDRVRWQLPTE